MVCSLVTRGLDIFKSILIIILSFHRLFWIMQLWKQTILIYGIVHTYIGDCYLLILRLVVLLLKFILCVSIRCNCICICLLEACRLLFAVFFFLFCFGVGGYGMEMRITIIACDESPGIYATTICASSFSWLHCSIFICLLWASFNFWIVNQASLIPDNFLTILNPIQYSTLVKFGISNFMKFPL